MSPFHRRFERLISTPDGLDPTMALFSVKRESGLPGMESRVFFDAVYYREDAITVVPFMLLDGETVVFPVACEPLSPQSLERVEQDVKRFAAASSAGDPTAEMTIYGKDADLLWVAQMQSGAPPMLGLSMYEQVFASIEHYNRALSYVMVGDLLDSNAGLGDGALLLRAFSHRIDAVTKDPRIRRVAKRLGRTFLLDSIPGKKSYAVAIAFDCDPSAVGEAAATLRSAAPRGVHLLSAIGQAGREALAGVGEVAMIKRSAFESSGATDDWMTIEDLREVPAEAAAVPREPDIPAPVTGTHPGALSVLFVLRPSAAAAFGGDVVQAEETAKALERRGHHVVLTTEAQPATAGFDIVHLTNLTATLETLEQVRAVRNFAGPLVLMPIFIDHADETIWGMEAHTACFSAALDNTQLEDFLAALMNRALTANNLPAPPQRADPFEHYTAHQREIVASVDYLIANAFSEVHRIYRYLDCTIPFSIAPSCADAKTYGVHARANFVAKYGLEDFVLCTGRFEARKNQLMLMHAVRDLPLKLLLIGSNAAAMYGAQLRAYRTKNTIVMAHMPQAELAGAYAAARVVALPSWDEVVSLSSLNGAISRAALVLSRNSYEHEYFGDNAIYCDPGDSKGIRQAVLDAWERYPTRAARRDELARRVERNYTWDRAAELTEAAYRRVLANNPRGERRRNAFLARA